MLSAGLLHVPGARPQPAPAGRTPGPSRGNRLLAPLRSVAFTRLRVGDLAPSMPVFEPLLGWLFSRTGFVVLAVLIIAAAWSWSGRGAELAQQITRISDLGPGGVLLGYLVFIAAKLLHEAGHAVAVRRMAAAEGHRVGLLPWGVSFMFLMPAPYVEVSSAWFLSSRWRRATVGLGGVATDLLVASLAALLWSVVGPGGLRDRLFDLVLICSVSSLLFNLNPLSRLDGYYVLSDLLGVPNMAARAQQGFARLVFAPLGLAAPPQPGDGAAAAYAVMSWLFRWTIYLGIFWIAWGVHGMLAAMVAAMVLLLFLGLPMARLATKLPDAFRRSPSGALVVMVVCVGLTLGALVVPLPHHIEAEGVVVRDGLVLIYPRADGLLLASAGPGLAAGRVITRLENPETARMLTQLEAEAAGLAIEARRARAAGADRVDAAQEREGAVARQIASLEEERALWVVTAPDGAVWEPLRAASLTGAWVRRDDNRPLGVLMSPGGSEIRLVLDQWDGPAALGALAARPGEAIPMRLRGAGAVQFTAQTMGPAIEARDSLPSPALATSGGGRIPAQIDARGEARPVERVFELRLRPNAPTPELRHGARVQARIALPPSPLVAQLWWRGRQAVQRRLAV